MRTSRPAHVNLAHLLAETAATCGNAVAIVDGASTTTYHQLHTRMRAIAAALVDAGVEVDQRVVIVAERGAAAAAAYFAVLAIGAVAVVVNETLRARQVEHILADSRARLLLVTSTAWAELASRHDRAVPVLELERIADAPRMAPPMVPRGEKDLAQIIYTSGSTGQPKGVMVGHGNLGAATATIAGYLGITSRDRIASLLPFGFVYGMSQLLCAVRQGATLVIERATLPRDVVHALAASRVSVLAAVPPLWARLLGGGGLPGAELPDLRVLTNAGGHLPVDTVRALRRAQPEARLFLMYGLTEVLRSTFLSPDEVDRHPGSIGRPIPGAEVLLVDESGEVVEGPGIGELVHLGPTVTLGYWDRPEQTARVYRPDPRDPAGGGRAVFSGDLVRRDEEGLLYYVSRSDRLIKTMGCRVGPDEVTDVLVASGEVAEAAVMGEPDPVWGTRIAAYLVLTPGGSLERVMRYCGRELPHYMQPSRYEVRDHLPLLSNGKHDIGALRVGVPATS